MEKRKNRKLNKEQSPQKTDKNYHLKSDAVESLVSDEVPQYTEEELNKYRRKSRFHISPFFWVLFNKAWFAGAVC